MSITITNLIAADTILYVFGTSPVRAAQFCLHNAELCDSYSNGPHSRSALAYARLAIEHANIARVARRARARYYKAHGYTASDPAIESVLDRAWHSAKRCVEKSLDLM